MRIIASSAEIVKIKPHFSKLRWAAFYLSLLVFALTSCSKPEIPSSPNNIKSIRVVMDNNYPPYAFLDKNGNMQGITVDQWKAWEKHTNIKVEITGLAWDQALQGMRNGEFDVIDTLFYTKERDEIYDFTEPYADIDVRIFFPENVSGFASTEDLHGFRVAVKTGDANADYLLRHGVNKLNYYDSYEEIVQAASQRKEAIFVIDGPPALYFLYKYDVLDRFKYSEPLYGGQFHRAVAKGNTALLDLVNQGFSDISAQEYQVIDNRWFGKQYPQNLDRIISYLKFGIAITFIAISILVVFNWSLRARVHERTRELEEALSNLKKSEAQFRDSIEFLPIPISIADAHDRVLIVNKNFTENYGYELKDMPLVSKWMTLAYPDPAYREKVLQQWANDVLHATESNTATPLREYEVVDKNGRKHITEIMMRPVRDLWISSFVDITGHKKTEEMLQESEIRYRVLFENSPIPLLEEDFSALKVHLDQLKENGVEDFEDYFNKHPNEVSTYADLIQIVDVNQAAVAWYGYENKKYLQVKLGQLLNSDEQRTFINELRPLISGGNRYKVAISRLAQDNKPLHLIINGTIAPGHEKNWGRVLVSIQDISELKQAEQDLVIAYDTTIEGWAKALELKDKETEGHSRRVTKLTLQVAQAMGIKEKQLVDIRRGTILHDIGKMSIPDEILRKNGSLTAEERKIVEKHPQIAYELLKDIPHLKNAIEIPYSHHEKWDGSGYPQGLKGEEIPLTARIFAIVDVWDALSSDRPYREAWDRERVIEYLRNESGKHFDPNIVDKFIELISKGEI
ncbi:MAG: transporter substrate-binding domain-containing protein [Anaerolineales bacterium]|nr:transporter substrate-binding domain-containing protein [Anaerolineales bacterium]